MARVLILGGTAWLGRAVAVAARAQGDHVTCLARGSSGDVPDGVTWVRADRDAPGAYHAVSRLDWDAVVDVSWQPGQVGSAVAALASRAAHWTYVSSGSVYQETSRAGEDESAPVVAPWTGSTATIAEYPGAKVRCEDIVTTALGERALIARAGLLVGPGDPSDRFGYWVGRFALAGAGPVLVPDAPAMPVQVLDTRDLADWLAAAHVIGRTGVVDAVGPARTFAEVIAASRAEARHTGELVAVHPQWLRDRDVQWWAGPRSLPLWLPMPDSAGAMGRSGNRARAWGLASRALDETLAHTLADERDRGLERVRRAGLTRADELALIAEAFRGS